MNEGGWLDLISTDLFWPYAILFWGVLLYRLCTKRMTRTEGVVLGLFLFHHVLEIVQIGIAGDWVFTMLPHRYFGIAAPVLWGWTAYGLLTLWDWKKVPRWQWFPRLIVVGFLLFVVGYELVIRLCKEYDRGRGRDAYVAAVQFAPMIQADYIGPEKTPNFTYPLNEYYTSRRPVVYGPYTILSWLVRGQGVYDTPTTRTTLSYDYVMVPTKNPPSFIPNAKRYHLMNEVQSLRQRWQLYKYIGPPGKRPDYNGIDGVRK